MFHWQGAKSERDAILKNFILEPRWNWGDWISKSWPAGEGRKFPSVLKDLLKDTWDRPGAFAAARILRESGVPLKILTPFYKRAGRGLGELLNASEPPSAAINGLMRNSEFPPSEFLPKNFSKLKYGILRKGEPQAELTQALLRELIQEKRISSHASSALIEYYSRTYRRYEGAIASRTKLMAKLIHDFVRYPRLFPLKDPHARVFTDQSVAAYFNEITKYPHVQATSEELQDALQFTKFLEKHELGMDAQIFKESLLTKLARLPADTTKSHCAVDVLRSVIGSSPNGE